MYILDAKQLIELAEKIRLAVVQQQKSEFSGEDAMEISDGLNDIMISAEKISELVRSLLKLDSGVEQFEAIIDIGFELKHINYHIKDMKFYSGLLEI